MVLTLTLLVTGVARTDHPHHTVSAYHLTVSAYFLYRSSYLHLSLL